MPRVNTAQGSRSSTGLLENFGLGFGNHRVIIMHPSRRAYVEEAENEVNFTPNLPFSLG
jgi:hypothetical protein